MKTIIGSAIGVLAIGLILIGAGLRGAASPSAPSFGPTAANPNVVPVANTGVGTAGAGPVMVNCGPGQRALVRQVLLNGEAVSQVACVADASGVVVNDGYSLPAARPLAQPVSYTAADRGYPASRTSGATERRVVYQQAPAERAVRKESSWKKPVLIIGGSTAAGAGIGGLVGGKKGALIGAALGGGAATIYQATRK